MKGIDHQGHYLDYKNSSLSTPPHHSHCLHYQHLLDNLNINSLVMRWGNDVTQ